MNLFKAASTVSLLTLASRVTGLVREQLLAASFGAGAATDAFNVAFRIPNLLRRLFAEGAFAQAFVPLLAATREAGGDDSTRSLVDAVATVLFWALLATCALGIVGAPVLVWLMASGLSRMDDAVFMTRVMFPYIACMSMLALFSGVLNTWRRFAVPAAAPLLLNFSMIAAATWGARWFKAQGWEPIHAMAFGVMLGGILQVLWMLPSLRRLQMLPRLGLAPGRIRTAWAHGGVRRTLAQMAPAVLGVSVAQISLLINTQIASHVAVGAVSWLSFADRLMEFPTALLGVALGVVLLPQLSAAQARGDSAAYSAMLDWGLRLVLLLALPCAVALLVFAQALVAVLFHYGAFGARDVQMTVQALMGYGVGLLGLIAIKVLAPGFYARQDVKTPVKIAIGVLVLTQLMNWLFVGGLGLGHAGLALSIGLAALLNAGFLLAGLLRAGIYRPLPGWGAFALRVGLASVLLGAALWWAAGAFDWIAWQAEGLRRALWLALVLGGVAVLYFGSLAASGLKLRSLLRPQA
jgi:putative peptidoglycan lipid II flippase